MSEEKNSAKKDKCAQGAGGAGNELGKLGELVEIMARLREPGGCPWDREQDFSTLTPYVVEEAYEVVSAIDSGSKRELKDELGDLLFQVVFLSRLGEEEGSFTITDVIQSSVEKMVRRHPHVFGDTKAEDSAEVLRNWVEIKKGEFKEEGEAPQGYLSKVPDNFPALMRAHKVSEKAAKVGFDWPRIEEVLGKVDEEMGELREALEAKDAPAIEEELGDLLFSIVNVGRFIEVNPEEALRKTIGKFINRFHYLEKALADEGISLEDASLEEMEGLWQKSKKS